MRYLVLFFLLSCMSPKKAERKINKMEQKYPSKFASKCAKEYPCIPRKADTISVVEYDFIEVECPDGQIPATSVDSTDTVYIVKYNERRVTKEIKVPCESKEITKYVLDSSKIKELTDRLDKANSDCQKATQKAKRYFTVIKILGLLLALLIMALYFVRKWVFKTK